MADTNTFETQDMSQALPGDGGDTVVADGNAHAGPQDPVIDGWGQQQKEDYTSDAPIVTAEASEGTNPLYPWDEPELGDVGPKIPAVEHELFGAPEERVSVGLDFSK